MILKYPNPILRKKAKKIAKITPEIKKIAEEMIKTTKKEKGAGLAANQIGKLFQIIAYNDGGKIKILINPQILKKSKKKIEAEEGCLSFPNLFGKVVRPAKIKVRGQNQFGKNITKTAEKTLAIILQHEIDHLNGILFVDKAIPNSLHRIEEKKIQALEIIENDSK